MKVKVRVLRKGGCSKCGAKKVPVALLRGSHLCLRCAEPFTQGLLR